MDNSNRRRPRRRDLSALEAERDALRSQCTLLFDRKRAIELQLEEYQKRLILLDEEIDGADEGDDDGVGHGGGRKYALTMPETQMTQATQARRDESSQGGAAVGVTKVKFEIMDENDADDGDNDKGGSARSNISGKSSMTFTQSDDFLTDPHTQTQRDDVLTDPHVPHEGPCDDDRRLEASSFGADGAASSARRRPRVSNSPPSDGQHDNDVNGNHRWDSGQQQQEQQQEQQRGVDEAFQQSSTPPGLKRSALAPSNSSSLTSYNGNVNGGVVNPYLKRPGSCSGSGRNSGGGAAATNPYKSNAGEGAAMKVTGAACAAVASMANPYQYLWGPSDASNASNNAAPATTGNNGGRGGGSTIEGVRGSNTLDKYSNTLERYLIRDNAAAAGQQAGTDASSSGGSLLTRSGEAAMQCGGGNVNDNSHRNPWTDRMMYHLRNTFGINQFRGHQEEIVNATMLGQDAFVVMRTGGGKSLTYQLPSVLESESPAKKVSIVISPLISLIRDQEEQMNRMVPNSALSFTSGMAGGSAEHARRWGLVRDPNAAPNLSLVFVTPEKVSASSKFKSEMEKLHRNGRLGRFVVDECHCACQWGHDFRPDYTKLGILKHHFPTVPVLAVTATASERVRHDCAEILKLRPGYRFFRSTANRPNLSYSVQRKNDNKEQVVKDMVAFIKANHVGQAGIIYTFSRKEADDVAKKLCANGISAKPYHSSVADTRKEQIQRSWMNNKTQVVVATIAFGLGINKPDVRFVLHHSLSKSLEAYYQESGRAGRDGKKANCVLYYSPKDVPRMLGMIHGEMGEGTFFSMAKYGQQHGNDALCRHIILATLGEADQSVVGRIEDLKRDCKTIVGREVGGHCQTCCKVVRSLNAAGEDCTLNQIVTRWRSKEMTGDFSFLKDNPPNDLSKEECERIIVSLLLEDVLHPDVRYTAYNSIVYLIVGPRGNGLISSPNPRALVYFPTRQSEKQAATAKNPVATTDGDGWISRSGGKATAKATKTKNAKAASKSKAKGKAKKGKAAAGKKRAATKKRKSSKAKMLEVVEINSSSSSSSESDDDDGGGVVLAHRRSLARNKKQKVLEDDISDGDDSEYEFSG